MKALLQKLVDFVSIDAEASHHLPVKLLTNLSGLHPKTVKAQRFHKLQRKKKNGNNNNNNNNNNNKHLNNTNFEYIISMRFSTYKCLSYYIVYCHIYYLLRL